MKRANIIVTTSPELELWGSFKKLCEAKGFDKLPYHTLKKRKFPIVHKDWTIHKVKFN